MVVQWNHANHILLLLLIVIQPSQIHTKYTLKKESNLNDNKR
jgi:hypothetical protein